MTVIIINPNSTASMTAAMQQAAVEAAPQLTFDAWTSHDGPASIQGAEDGVTATPPLLKLIEQANDRDASGIIIGCFDDTALSEAAAMSRCPVIGIGQASYHLAALRNWRFSVVTTLQVSVPVIEANIRNMGLGGYVGQVRASNVAVLALEDRPDVSEQLIVEEALRAERDDNVDAIVLGCAGMVNVTRSVRQSLGVAVIDPVVAAAACMKWLL